METFLQQLINGLVLGSVYALVALGYTMVYGILGLINFAHGDIVMIGAMVATAVVVAILGLEPNLPHLMTLFIGVFAGIIACMITGFLIERIAYRPLRHAPKLSPLITAIGVSIVLQNMAMIIWGKHYIPFPHVINIIQYSFFNASFSNLQVVIVGLSALTMLALFLLVQKTKLGCAMRATASSPEIARLMGVNTNSIISVTFIIGPALAAIAGVMVSAYYGVIHYYMGFMLGLKAFTAAVLGGIGNLFGAMLGGLLLGVIESMAAGYIGPLTGGFLGSHYQDIFAFIVLITVLVFRPSGLLGAPVNEKL